MIKITSGIYRSRVIQTPEEGTLPTKNRVREAMMSMIQSSLSGARVLDLFAGSGALGIEALSRGAKEAVFVDASPAASRIVTQNLQTLKEKRATVLTMDYQAALTRLQGPFDVVFLDPPYAMKEAYQIAIDTLLGRSLLNEECVIIAEYEGALDLNTEAFSSRRDYTYGKTKVVLLRRSI